MDTMRTTCLLCGRAYAGTRARPRWAFWPDGRLAGTVHTTCSVSHGNHRRYVYSGSAAEPVEQARSSIWLTTHGEPAAYPSDQWAAEVLLTHGCQTALNDEQVALLAHWQNGPMQLAEERAHALLDAYRALVEEYAAWRATIVDEEA